KGLFQKKDNIDESVDFKNPETLSNVKSENREGLLKKYLERFLQRVNNALESFKNEEIFTDENVRGIDAVDQLGMALDEFNKNKILALPINKSKLNKILKNLKVKGTSRDKFLAAFVKDVVDEYTSKYHGKPDAYRLSDIGKYDLELFYNILTDGFSVWSKKNVKDKMLPVDSFLDIVLGSPSGREILEQNNSYSIGDDINKITEETFSEDNFDINLEKMAYINIDKNNETYKTCFAEAAEKYTKLIEEYGKESTKEDENNINLILKDVCVGYECNKDDFDEEYILSVIERILDARVKRYAWNKLNKYKIGESGNSVFIKNLNENVKAKLFSKYLFDKGVEKIVNENPALFAVPGNLDVLEMSFFLGRMLEKCMVELSEDNCSYLNYDDINYFEYFPEGININGRKYNNVYNLLAVCMRMRHAAENNITLSDFISKIIGSNCLALDRVRHGETPCGVIVSECVKNDGVFSQFGNVNNLYSLKEKECTNSKFVMARSIEYAGIKDILRIRGENAFKKIIYNNVNEFKENTVINKITNNAFEKNESEIIVKENDVEKGIIKTESNIDGEDVVKNNSSPVESITYYKTENKRDKENEKNISDNNEIFRLERNESELNMDNNVLEEKKKILDERKNEIENEKNKKDVNDNEENLKHDKDKIKLYKNGDVSNKERTVLSTTISDFDNKKNTIEINFDNVEDREINGVNGEKNIKCSTNSIENGDCYGMKNEMIEKNMKNESDNNDIKSNTEEISPVNELSERVTDEKEKMYFRHDIWNNKTMNNDKKIIKDNDILVEDKEYNEVRNEEKSNDLESNNNVDVKYLKNGRIKSENDQNEEKYLTKDTSQSVFAKFGNTKIIGKTSSSTPDWLTLNELLNKLKNSTGTTFVKMSKMNGETMFSFMKNKGWFLPDSTLDILRSAFPSPIK
ncbi:MAG: hypothetical protein IJ599_02445, partial [Alphaproteobacteria bacterium]|nr:hypothetical protein [Alphaproteobacteria bacterium]